MFPAYRQFKETRFFGSLDGMRAVSILGVIWVHSWIGTPYFDWLNSIPILRRGAFGVDIFFTISGFLITTLLLRERDKYGEISLRDFYIRRSLRIWPLYYTVLGAYIILVLLTERASERGRAFFHYLPSYLTYTYTWFGPRGTESPAIFNFAWSLSTEEQFYIFWPFIIRLLRHPWPVAAVLAVIGIRVATGYQVLDGLMPDGSFVSRVIGSISVPICAGSLLALILHVPRGFRALYPLLGRKVTAPLAVMLMMLCLIPASKEWLPLTWIVLPIFIGACVIREDHGLAWLFRWRPLAFMGAVSYGMYLFNTLAVKSVRPPLNQLGIRHPVLTLHEAGASNHYRQRAADFAAAIIERFGDSANGGFYFTAENAPDLIVRQKVATDSPLPSGNAVAIQALLQLGQTEPVRATLVAFAGQLESQSEGMSALVQAAHAYLRRNPPISIEPQPAAARQPQSPSQLAEQAVVVDASWAGKELHLHLRIAEGLHINAAEAGPGLIATRLSIGADIAPEVLAINYPPARLDRPSFADSDIPVYGGDVTVAVRFKSNMAGRPPLKLALTYQACDNNACLPPVTRHIEVPTP